MITTQIFNKIKEAKSIVIFGHVLPDGDCYGSELGLKEAILATFKDKAVYAVGTGLPRFFDVLAPLDIVDDEIIKDSLAIVVDVSNHERIEDQRYKLAKDIVKIDHHIFSNEYGSVEWIDTTTVAAAQMIAELIMKHNMEISTLGAEALYLGIVTDSGRFQYAATSEKTFAAVSFLLTKGVNFKKLYDTLYAVEEKDLRFKGYIFSHYITDDGVVYIKFDYKTTALYGVTPDYAAGQVNQMANIKGYPIWLTFSEKEDGSVRVEFRSSGVPVQPVAVKFGGGGHKQAAGCVLSSLDQAIDVVNECKKAIKEEN